MLLKIDPQTAALFSLIHEIFGELRVTDHRRCYVTGRDCLAILVLRNGFALQTLTGQVADTAVGWDKVAEPFARPEDVGEFHITITCYRIVLNAHSHGPMGRIRSLSSILKYAPKRTP